LRAVVLIAVLALAGLGARGAAQNQAACTLTRERVVVDLDNVKHRHILRHVFVSLDAANSERRRLDVDGSKQARGRAR
jgi:hypothetical protein